MCDLAGRTAIVTGAASGIGAATAIAFARAGADVALGWLPADPHDVGVVRDQVESAGRRALVHELDVCSTKSVDAFVAAAKAGVVGLVKTLAVEYGSRGVTANAVAPGVIESPQSIDPVNSIGVEGVAAAGRANPLGRVGKPRDVAALYRFLASEDAGFVNGQLITVDGGRSLLVKD